MRNKKHYSPRYTIFILNKEIYTDSLKVAVRWVLGLPKGHVAVVLDTSTGQYVRLNGKAVG